MQKLYGFTLAEVLITLGIIGVVAAMTMPALVAAYNNHITEVRLKKFYSIMNQAIYSLLLITEKLKAGAISIVI